MSEEKIIIVGNGAREHALACGLGLDRQKKTRTDRKVMVFGGNAGLAQSFECFEIKNLATTELAWQIKKHEPKLVIIGPEAWLDAGLADVLEQEKIPVFAPSQKASLIESSKSFMKSICHKAQVKTAQHIFCQDAKTALNALATREYPQVIKADGLCAGKGVSIVNNFDEAQSHIYYLYNQNGFSDLKTSNQNLVIEDFISGQELSIFALTDGDDAVLFSPLQDYKRLKDNQEGPNTGGMGAVTNLGTNINERESFLGKIKEDIFLPVLRQMSLEGRKFKGLLYAGLMLNKNGIYVLEFNARFGDPETQCLISSLNNDIYPLLLNAAQGKIHDLDFWQKQILDCNPAMCLVFASSNYPFGQSEDTPLSLPQMLPEQAQIFFAATGTNEQGELLAKSGRVLSLCAKGESLEEARSTVYQWAKQINFNGMQYRKDIGSNLSKWFF